MKRAMGASCGGAVVSLFVVAIGCVDLSPLDYVPPEASAVDAAPIDAALADAVITSCEACFTDKCEGAWKACKADTKCKIFADCMATSVCWSSSLADLTNLSPCLITCSLKSGITSQNSPSTALASPLFTCAQDANRCGTPCMGIADQ